jgi:hypothetical protein
MYNIKYVKVYLNKPSNTGTPTLCLVLTGNKQRGYVLWHVWRIIAMNSPNTYY